MKRFDRDIIADTKSRIFGHPEFDSCNSFTFYIDMFIIFANCCSKDIFLAVTLDFSLPFFV